MQESFIVTTDGDSDDDDGQQDIELVVVTPDQAAAAPYQARSGRLAIQIGISTSDMPVDATPEEVTVTACELNDMLLAGATVYPCMKDSKSVKSPRAFVSADVAFVTVDTARLPLSTILEAPFTRDYLTLAIRPKTEGAGQALLAFRLHTRVDDQVRMRNIMHGLTTMYGDWMSCESPVHGFRCSVDSVEAVVPDASLSRSGQAMLEKLGKESRHFGAKAYLQAETPPRSYAYQLENFQFIRLANGEERDIAGIHTRTPVYCPLHVDQSDTAVLILSAGKPVIECKRCRRTFGMTTAPRFDFDFAERKFLELAHASNDEVPKQVTPVLPELSKAELMRIVPPEAPPLQLPKSIWSQDKDFPQFSILQEARLPRLPIVKGVTFVKSNKNTGKSHQLKIAVATFKKYGLRVLLIVHRRTLAQSLADNLGLTNYIAPAGPDLLAFDDEGDDDATITRVPPTDYYAVCLDSLDIVEPQQYRYDVVLIDESEQVFGHLISPTFKDKRMLIYHTFFYHLRMAKSVYLLDADLGMITMEAMFQAGLKPETAFHVIINQPLENSRVPTQVYGKGEQLTMKLREAVAAGEKCFVTTNSINEVKRLHVALADVRPGVRIQCIHSENSQTPETQKLIRNISAELEHNIDVLIVSPALGTGIDISYRDAAGKPRIVVDKVFGKFLRNITTHFDIDQALSRVREPGEVHVWVDDTELYFECEPAVLRATLERTVGRQHALQGFTNDGKPILGPESGLVGIWAEILGAARGSKNRLAQLFAVLRNRGGSSLSHVPLDDSDKVQGGAVMKMAKQLVAKQRLDAMMDAASLEPEDAADLAERDRHGDGITLDERAQLERYRIEKFYDDTLTADLIILDDEGRMREKVVNLEQLLKLKLAEEADRREAKRDRDMPVFDKQLRVLRRSMLYELIEAAGFFAERPLEFSIATAVGQSNLAEFARRASLMSKQYQHVFGKVMRRDVADKPVSQLREVLDLVGLKLGQAEVSQVGGPKVRLYRLDEPRLLTGLDIVRQREIARQKRERESERN